MKTFKTIYDHLHPISPSGGVSLTDQQYKDECDVNAILKSYRVTGFCPSIRPAAVGGDFSDVGDFAACLERINRAKEEFAALPSAIRDRFGNDPRTYVEFVLDPANTDECVRLGLKEKLVPPSRTTEQILESIESKVTAPKGAASAA